jgi:hypothetical protein
MRVADGLARQLQTLGLDRQERPPVDLSTYLAQRRSSGARAESQATQVRDDYAPAEPTAMPTPAPEAAQAPLTLLEEPGFPRGRLGKRLAARMGAANCRLALGIQSRPSGLSGASPSDRLWLST